jgi:hypothetical protein
MGLNQDQLQKVPLVSIGMPVYNGERFLEKTLNSLLAQDYTNIEIIICDNASEDSSKDICLEFEARDRRIKYHRNIKNIGLAANGNQTITLSSGEYFMSAADHDLWDSSYISTLLSGLLDNPSVSLCYGRTVLIDDQDNTMGVAPDVFDTRGMTLAEGFRKFIWEVSWGNMGYGLFRSNTLIKALPVPNTIGNDLVLLGRISLLGEIAQIDEPLFFRRKNRPEETASEQTARQKRFMSLSSRSMEAEAPWLMMSHAHLESLTRSDISDHQKDYIAGEVIKACVSRFGNLMAEEIQKKATSAFNELIGNTKKSVLDNIYSLELFRFAGIAMTFFPFLEGINMIAGIGYLRMDLSDIAKEFFERELRVYPNSRNARELVDCIHSGGAINSRAIDPTRPVGTAEKVSALNERGEELFREDDFVGAFVAFKNAVEIDPKDERAYNNIGMLSRELGNTAEAIEFVRKAIEVDPDNSNGFRTCET